MSVTPLEILENAQSVRQTQSNEAGYRTVISRAYYAAYHASYAFHASLPVPGSAGGKSGRHEQLVSQLTSPSIKSGDARHFLSRRIGTILRDMSRARVKADYGIGAEVIEGEADATLLQGEEIRKLCAR